MRTREPLQMQLDRTAILRHKATGMSFKFEPGKPVRIPPQCIKAAISMGARVVDGDTPDIFNEEKPQVNHGPIDPEERLEEIVEVVTQMIERNDRDEWTGTGTPSVPRVTELLGYKVQKSEVVEAFAKAREVPEEVNESDD